MIAAALGRHGEAFDILVNVAGIDRPGHAHDLSLCDFERVFAVTCAGPAFLITSSCAG
jgi:NAD(P)-dependent dehydrogenase (short-subunit alcohol dehydrogenase family)